MPRKLNVAIIFGGPSVEHEVSVVSARNIFESLDKSLYTPVLLGMTHDSEWRLIREADMVELQAVASNVGKLICWARHESQAVVHTECGGKNTDIDVAFPMMHGSLGEDGGLQGMLQALDVPYVGADVMSSALCMDKALSKQLLQNAGIPVVPYVTLSRYMSFQAADIMRELGGDSWFVKPSSGGSSVGISHVRDVAGLATAIENAFRLFDHVIIERGVVGREIECAVLGDIDDPEVSPMGEIVPRHDFYSYEAKYLDDNGADLIAPADLADDRVQQIQSMAKKAFQVVRCHGLARIDFFVAGDDIYLNEINTLPGFTPISMYPKLWALTGLSCQALVTRLIQLAQIRDRHLKSLVRYYSDIA